MKYSFMSFSCPKATFAEMLELARRFGYDGIEPRIDAKHHHGVELKTKAQSRADIRRAAAEAGVAICCIATSSKFADPREAAQQVEVLRRAIDLAADVGAPRVRVFGGKIPEGLSRDQAARHVAEALRSAADAAAARGVTICMETHDDWCDPTHVAAVMQQANHAAVAVNWDIMHPVRFAGWTMERAFEVLRPWIRHVHFHDGSKNPADRELRPVGQGDIDHRTAVRLLLTTAYEGYLSGEWIDWQPADVHLPRELAAMKAYESE